MQLGLLLGEARMLRLVRPDDPIDLLVLGFTFVDPPRGAAAKRLGLRLRGSHPELELVPYVWQWVSHGFQDRGFGQGLRKIAGDVHNVGQLRPTREVEQAWESMKVLAASLPARRAVLKTPPSLAPGALGRKRLSEFVAAHPEISFTWEPEGLWTLPEAASLARSIGVTLLVPALVGGRPNEDLPRGAWLRVDGFGRQQRLDPEAVDTLMDLTEELEPEALLFAGPRARANLAAFLAARGL